MDDPSRTQPRSRGRRLGRTLGLVGGGTGLVLALGLGVFPTRSYLDQRSEVSDAEQRLAVLREQNEALSDQLDQLSTPEEIERLAREEYNLVRPGEEAYSVLPAPLPALELPQVWPFGPLSGPPDSQ